MKLQHVALMLVAEGVQPYASDWQGFNNDAASRGHTVDQQGQNYTVTNKQGQMVGFWDGSAGGGYIADSPEAYQQFANTRSVGTSVRDQRNQEARELPAKAAAAAGEVASSEGKGFMGL